eukprot:scaffold18903_cov80-Skeletonema_marinoi.AAC.1
MAADGYYIYNGREAVPRNATRVRIHKSLTVIPARAFDENRNIEELDCHVDVKTVGAWAFRDCTSLRVVIMPGVEVIEKCAFNSCNALTDVECDKLERIGRNAFVRCQSLGSINLPSAKIVEADSFNFCTDLTNVIFGSMLESIRGAAFRNCTSLELIAIPLKDNMITADNIFKECYNLKQVDLVEKAVLCETVAALLLEEWKNDMKDKLGVINQSLPTTCTGNWMDAGGKAEAVQSWIRSVLCNIVRYKAQHRRLLNEAATILQHALPNDIVNKNLLPFLELPSYTFEGED